MQSGMDILQLIAEAKEAGDPVYRMVKQDPKHFISKESSKIKYLITKRAENKKAFPGKWTVPGGGLETDDYIDLKPTTETGHWYYAIENALRREVKEEVNL